MSKRFITKQEPGNDWGVFDTKRQSFICGGLDREEAEETADVQNKQEQQLIDAEK